MKKQLVYVFVGGLVGCLVGGLVGNATTSISCVKCDGRHSQSTVDGTIGSVHSEGRGAASGRVVSAKHVSDCDQCDVAVGQRVSSRAGVLLGAVVGAGVGAGVGLVLGFLLYHILRQIVLQIGRRRAMLNAGKYEAIRRSRQIDE